jgi:hypothetical protein
MTQRVFVMWILDIWLYRYASTLCANRWQPDQRCRGLAYHTKRQHPPCVPLRQAVRGVHSDDQMVFFGLMT